MYDLICKELQSLSKTHLLSVDSPDNSGIFLLCDLCPGNKKIRMRWKNHPQRTKTCFIVDGHEGRHVKFLGEGDECGDLLVESCRMLEPLWEEVTEVEPLDQCSMKSLF